jgi:hypothetical protein
MSLLTRRKDVERAEHRLLLAQTGWHERTQALRTYFEKHREACVLGGGFAGGFIAGLLPLRSIARVGSATASIVGMVLRTPLTALLAEQLQKRTRDTQNDAS